MGHLPIIERKPATPRTADNWKNGGLRFDDSNDAELAAAGDADAKARIKTRQKLALAKLSRKDPIE